MTRIRSEDDWMDGKPPVTGTAEPISEDGHTPHVYLYVPDASQDTGFVAHRVPMRTERTERRSVGFRHR